MKEMLKKEIKQCLEIEFGTQVEFKAFHPYGSSISQSYKIETNKGNFFIKTNNKSRFPEMYEAEKRGLDILKTSECFVTPEIIAVGQIQETSYILMYFIDEKPRQEKMFENFGQSLAKMHRSSWKAYGLAHSNYIGSLRQTNAPRGHWVPFFIEERLQPMLKLAVESRKLETSVMVSFEKLYKKMETLMPEEQPSMLHGDLWSGNFISQGENVALIDPAVYYGSREMDLAMTRLFGGFPDRFYDAYNDFFPLEPGWQERVDLCNLYPILVHVNLFGSDYISRLKYNLAKYL